MAAQGPRRGRSAAGGPPRRTLSRRSGGGAKGTASGTAPPSPSQRRRRRRRRARVSGGGGAAAAEASAADGTLNRLLTALESAGRRNDGPKVREVVGKLLALPALYAQCYEALRSNPGMMAVGLTADGEPAPTLDGMDLDFCGRLADTIRRGQFQWGPLRRVEIPKRSGGTRPLGIAASRDKIVQKALATILEAVAEPRFLDCSHGFRRGRGAHSALALLKRRGRGTSWAVEGDIEACFDSFDHRRLMATVRRWVPHQIFGDLVVTALRARVVTLTSSYLQQQGTPQGSVLSPLLANVYLHALDEFVLRGEALAPYRGNRGRKMTPEYRRLRELPPQELAAAEALRETLGGRRKYWRKLSHQQKHRYRRA